MQQGKGFSDDWKRWFAPAGCSDMRKKKLVENSLSALEKLRNVIGAVAGEVSVGAVQPQRSRAKEVRSDLLKHVEALDPEIKDRLDYVRRKRVLLFNRIAALQQAKEEKRRSATPGQMMLARCPDGHLLRVRAKYEHEALILTYNDELCPMCRRFRDVHLADFTSQVCPETQVTKLGSQKARAPRFVIEDSKDRAHERRLIRPLRADTAPRDVPPPVKL